MCAHHTRDHYEIYLVWPFDLTSNVVMQTPLLIRSHTLALGSPHPHDIVPLNSSDIFRKSSYGSTGVGGGGGPPRHKQSRLGIQTQRGASGALYAALKNAKDRARALLNLRLGEI